MAVYDDIDLDFDWNGDFKLGHDKDLADTSHDQLLSLRQQLHDICASMLNDWEVYPRRTAGLDTFIGEPNISRTADRLHDGMRIAIVSAGIVKEEDLDIRIIPVHIHKLLIMIKILATPTSNNNLNETGLVVKLVFDFLTELSLLDE